MLSATAIPISFVPVHMPDGHLPVPCFTQGLSQWCWATCAEMVFRFYGLMIPKCEVATWLLKRSCCPPTDACNCTCSVQGDRDDVRDIYLNLGHFPSDSALRVDRALTADELECETLTRPVEILRQLSEGGAHLELICGWLKTDQGNRFYLHNPLGSCSGFGYTDVLPYTDILTDYAGQQWIKTWKSLSPKEQ